MTETSARRTPNTSMTAEQWQDAMRLFCEEGLSDARIGRRFNLTGGTVARDRSNHGIGREAFTTRRGTTSRSVPLFYTSPLLAAA